MNPNPAFIPTIRPSSAIRTDYRAFSQLVHEVAEPVVVTNNGEADLIVMSPEAYNMREARYRVEEMLLEGDRAIIAGDLMDHETFMAQLRSRFPVSE
jgi:PHD/YefM family antitoxin component YafN of YafNO toxin-antitoxin module